MKILRGLAKGGLAGGGLLALYFLAREWTNLTPDGRSLVAVGVMIACLCALAVWATREIRDCLHNSTVAADHALNAAQDAHRCVTVLRTWWSEAVLIDPAAQPEPQPATEPFEPPTMPEHRAIERIDDVELARSLAELEDRVRTWRTKPTPYRRGAV